MTAVIAGCTGLVGAELLKLLLEDHAITHVIAITRKPLESIHPKLSEVLVSNLEQLMSLTEKLRGDYYFCCLGTTIKVAGSQAKFRKIDHDGIVDFGKIAKANNSKSFVLISSMGADKKSLFFYNKVKGETEDDLKVLGLQSLTIFRPGLLLGVRNGFRPAEKIATAIFKPLAKILPDKMTKTAATEAIVLARRMLDEGKKASSVLKIIKSSDI